MRWQYVIGVILMMGLLVIGMSQLDSLKLKQTEKTMEEAANLIKTQEVDAHWLNNPYNWDIPHNGYAGKPVHFFERGEMDYFELAAGDMILERNDDGLVVSIATVYPKEGENRLRTFKLESTFGPLPD